MPRFRSISCVLLTTIVWTACLLPASLLAAPASMPAFSATYSVRYGLLRGSMTLQLEPRGSGYVYMTALRPRGVASLIRRGEIRESTNLVPGEGLVRPLDYSSVDTIAKPARRARYGFDSSTGRVTGTYKGRTVDVPMRAGGQNRISAQVAIMQALHSGIELSEFSVFDRGRWRSFRFEIIPDQVATTPTGEFETVEVRYTSDKSGKSWSLHCATALAYLPVMIVYREDGATKSRAVLADFRNDQ